MNIIVRGGSTQWDGNIPGIDTFWRCFGPCSPLRVSGKFFVLVAINVTRVLSLFSDAFLLFILDQKVWQHNTSDVCRGKSRCIRWFSLPLFIPSSMIATYPLFYLL